MLLDMDGTLLDLHFDNFFWRQHIPKVFAEQNNLSIEQAQQQVLSWYQEKEGTLDWYCIDYWSEKLAIDIPAQKLAAQSRIDFRPGAQQFLQVLAEDPNKRVVLLTNAHPKTLMIKVEKLLLAPYFDEMVSSHDVGFPKEDERFWPAVQKQLNFERERAVFIDDSEAVLSSAQQFGIAYVWGIIQPDSQSEPTGHKHINVPSVDSFDYLTQLSKS